MIAEVTAGMEIVSVVDDNENDKMSLEAEAQPKSKVSHYEMLKNNGPAVGPIPFDVPLINRGKRESVLVWHSNKHQQFDNVLLSNQNSKVAYWKVPHKRPIKTIMGHVDICFVLRKSVSEKSDDDLSENDDSDSENDDDDDDVVFELTKQKVAIKVNYCSRIEALKEKHAEDPMKEIAAMQFIGNQHPNVLGCLDVLFDADNINVVLEYCSGGDLFELLQENLQNQQPGISEAEAKILFRQIISGVHYMHQKGVCHRDLSPENVMLKSPDCSGVIIDMGMCLRFSPTSLVTPQGTCGKLPYMSPEIYTNRADWDPVLVDSWTCGTILWCMLTGNRSYQRAHRSDAQFYWMTHGIDRLLTDWGVTHLTAAAKDLLRGLLQIDPRERYTIQDVIEHEWMAE